MISLLESVPLLLSTDLIRLDTGWEKCHNVIELTKTIQMLFVTFRPESWWELAEDFSYRIHGFHATSTIFSVGAGGTMNLYETSVVAEPLRR